MMCRTMSLAVTPSATVPVTANAHVFRFFLDQALRRHDVLDLGSADAEGERGKGAVSRGVRIPADHGHSRQGCTLLRADDVHDALACIAHLEFGQFVLVAIGVRAYRPAERATGSVMPCSRPVVGTLWSGTARIERLRQSGRLRDFESLEGLR